MLYKCHTTVGALALKYVKHAFPMEINLSLETKHEEKRPRKRAVLAKEGAIAK